MNMLLIVAFLVLLAIVFATRSRSAATVPTNIMDPAGWEIGPIVNGENYSKGVPLHPRPHKDGWCIDIPHPNAEAGHVHYVTVPTNALAGKTKIALKYRFEMDEGVRLCPVHSPEAPGLLTLYFQRKNDDFSGQGAGEIFRWYAGFATQPELHNGDYVAEAPLDSNWTAVLVSSRASNPDGFAAALADTGRVGFVLGGGDGLGHGVFATGPARLVVTSFEVV